MLVDTGTAPRALRSIDLPCDLAVVGGGLSGVCAAVTAARQGLKVVLVQDRPVLGGNASSEVRLWVLGATSHMGNNNRWAREGGVVDEILLENTHRNPEGNPLIFDTVLLEWVVREPNITLLLNTAIHEVEKDGDAIASVTGFCSQNSTRYTVRAPLFCDASGDGVVGFLAGAAFRMGAESKEEFDEGFAPEKEYGELLGHSLYFYSRDTGRPVKYAPPSFALKDITQIPRWRQFNAGDHGCKLWWIEYGGRLDTIHDTETIKWELWKVIYGLWNHIKNSGQFPEAENLTLEWVGTIPGKRESRRFEGDYVISQRDVVEQRRHADAVSFGGWAIDLHPADGVYSPQSGCTQWHSKGVYQIPYRTMYSRNVPNLFLTGRLISASHVAFGSTRVMATCGHNAQAVGVAAAICLRDKLRPRDLCEPSRMASLQAALLRTGQFIPHVAPKEDRDLAASAKVTVSSTFALGTLPAGEASVPLDRARAMLLPVGPGRVPAVTFYADAEAPTDVVVQLRACSREDGHTPDEVLESHVVTIGGEARGPRRQAAVAVQHANAAAHHSGVATPAAAASSAASFRVEFKTIVETPRYLMICLVPTDAAAAAHVRLATSDVRVTGVLSLAHGVNKAVSKSAVQSPPAGLGVDTFEFWLPERRPGGRNLAMRAEPPIATFAADHVTHGPERPTGSTNAWVAALDDERPWLELRWPTPQIVREVTLCLDGDFDHPLESVLMGHPEREMPFTVRDARVLDDSGRVLGEITGNHLSRRTIPLEQPVQTASLRVELTRPTANVPAALFRVRVR